jgi:hypothetical protein
MVAGAAGQGLTRADANRDGRVTEGEMVAAAQARFDAIDSNRDGTLSPEERRAARAQRRAMQRAG